MRRSIAAVLAAALALQDGAAFAQAVRVEARMPALGGLPTAAVPTTLLPLTPFLSLGSALPTTLIPLTPSVAARFAAGSLALPPGSAVDSAGDLGGSPLAELGGIAAGLPQEGRAAGPEHFKPFDGARPVEASPEGAVEPETVTRETAGPEAAQVLDLWFSGKKAKKQLKASEVTALIRPIKNKNSGRYWEKFRKGAAIRVVSRGSTVFMSRVEHAATKRLRELTRDDFKGVYPAAELKGKSAPQLRKRLLGELDEAHRKAVFFGSAAPLVLTQDTEVRVVRILPYAQAKSLPENKDDSVYEPKDRAPVEIPAALGQLHRFLPKAVVLDLRLFPDAVPFELLEDVTKLMKAGVYVLMLSDKRSEGPGSVEEQLTKALTPRQRDLVTRYKLVVLADGGNHIYKFDGGFARSLPSDRFTQAELEIMELAARQGGLSALSRRGHELLLELPPGADPQAAEAALRSRLEGFRAPSRPYAVSPRVEGARTLLAVRPHSLATAVPRFLEALRDHEGLFVNPSDLMVVSQDEAVLKAFEGGTVPAAHAPGLEGPALADMSLAALLGEYRENRPGDFAASASKITAFDNDRATKSGGDFYSIFMFMGHVMHSAFNWAVWVYRNTGALPGADEVVARAAANWSAEDKERTRHLLEESGGSMADYEATMRIRLRQMHGMLAGLLERYPIVIGTELPNLYSLGRHKKGQRLYRDVFRVIFDMAVARETPEGLEVQVVDFKSGQTSTNQNFDKDTQVQLYDLVVRRIWETVPLPYGGTGALKKVAKTGVTFIFPPEMKQASIDEWARLKFEKWLRNIMNRMRRENDIAIPKPPKAPKVRASGTRARTAKAASQGFDTLKLPKTVPGLKIRRQWAQRIVKGTKTIEYRTVPTAPKAFVAIIQTYTEERVKRPAEVVGFARIEKVDRQADGTYRWHLSHVTPVEPYPAPSRPGAIIWVKDVPVKGAESLRGEKKG